MNQIGWRKPSKSSGGENSDCAEARTDASGFQVRDSKLGEGSPIFELKTADFKGLLKAAGRSWPPDMRRDRPLRGRSLRCRCQEVVSHFRSEAPGDGATGRP